MPPRQLRVLFISQQRAEQMRPPQRCALISVTDRTRPVAVLRPGWGSVLRLAFDDADPIAFPGMNGDLRPLSPDQAEELAAYVAAQLAQCTRVVVHCRFGISRSGAIAKADRRNDGRGFPGGLR